MDTMNQDVSGISSNLDKEINNEQFDQVVEAILAGKYSWACVLMLRFAGYNPLHYIPYRTYNRLLKENPPENKSQQQQIDNSIMGKPSVAKRPESNVPANCLGKKIKDLAYLEVVAKQKTEVRGGGNLDPWWSDKIREFNSNFN
jgi:hypothetical protein